jgi:uncharacterized membrane protein HdeD (DUF308 family)
MTYPQERDLVPFLRQIDHVSRNWGWFLFLGIALVVLGFLAVGSAAYTTLITVFLIGALLIAGGAIQIIQAFSAHRWSGVFLSLLVGILYLVTGFLCLYRPEASALSLTLLIAAVCLIGGLFRMIASVLIRFQHWGWVFFNGLITFILGWLILSGWPVSGLWVIGLFIGIDLILAGWSWIVLSLAARRQIP